MRVLTATRVPPSPIPSEIPSEWPLPSTLCSVQLCSSHLLFSLHGHRGFPWPFPPLLCSLSSPLPILALSGQHPTLLALSLLVHSVTRSQRLGIWEENKLVSNTSRVEKPKVCLMEGLLVVSTPPTQASAPMMLDMFMCSR